MSMLPSYYSKPKTISDDAIFEDEKIPNSKLNDIFGGIQHPIGLPQEHSELPMPVTGSYDHPDCEGNSDTNKGNSDSKAHGIEKFRNPVYLRPLIILVSLQKVKRFSTS